MVVRQLVRVGRGQWQRRELPVFGGDHPSDDIAQIVTLLVLVMTAPDWVAP